MAALAGMTAPKDKEKVSGEAAKKDTPNVIVLYSSLPRFVCPPPQIWRAIPWNGGDEFGGSAIETSAKMYIVGRTGVEMQWCISSEVRLWSTPSLELVNRLQALLAIRGNKAFLLAGCRITFVLIVFVLIESCFCYKAPLCSGAAWPLVEGPSGAALQCGMPSGSVGEVYSHVR